MDDLFSVFGETSESATAASVATTSQAHVKPQKRDASRITVTKTEVPAAKKKKQQSMFVRACICARAQLFRAPHILFAHNI